MKGKYVKKLKMMLVAAATLATVVTTGAPASAAPQSAGQDNVNGGFQMTVHSHSTTPATLQFPDVKRLKTNFVEGDTFQYSSRICTANARFNNVGLNFTPDYPGVDDDGDGTASVRHKVEGTITKQNPGGTTGKLEGTITSVLCAGSGTTSVPTDNAIVTNFKAKYSVASNDALQIIGKFKISPDESTGTFADLKGRGSIEGVFTCLGATVCANIGEYTDFVSARGDLSKGPGKLEPGLVGTFSDRTVTTG